VRRDLDERFGPGSTREVVALLRASIGHALAHREESIAYTMPFALANAAKKGAEDAAPPTPERIDRYITMYVNDLTVDMGDCGREAVSRLLSLGAELGLCPPAGEIDVL
jgi:1,4-dihydroxy-6-naphthoate synthase